jgi:hypothetical protein
VDGEPEGGYTDMYELICCDCGDDPWVDYREVPAEFRRTRGPYLFTAGIAAYGTTADRGLGIAVRCGRRDASRDRLRTF